MRKKLFNDLLLFLIFISKGKWNWYQLERELELRGLGGKVRVTEIIDQLVKEGFVYENLIQFLVVGSHAI